MRARALRTDQTDAEARLWSRLRDRQLQGMKFRRQRPIGPYFADFACLEARLVIEIDGGQHGKADAVAYDLRRAQVMAALGFETLRFWGNDVLTQTEAVLEKILSVIERRCPHPSPLPQAGEGASRSADEVASDGAPNPTFPQRGKEPMQLAPQGSEPPISGVR